MGLDHWTAKEDPNGWDEKCFRIILGISLTEHVRHKEVCKRSTSTCVSLKICWPVSRRENRGGMGMWHDQTDSLRWISKEQWKRREREADRKNAGLKTLLNGQERTWPLLKHWLTTATDGDSWWNVRHCSATTILKRVRGPSSPWSGKKCLKLSLVQVITAYNGFRSCQST